MWFDDALKLAAMSKYTVVASAWTFVIIGFKNSEKTYRLKVQGRLCYR